MLEGSYYTFCFKEQRLITPYCGAVHMILTKGLEVHFAQIYCWRSIVLTLINLIFLFAILQQRRTFIQMRTVLKVVDNLGAKKVMCIQALKGKKGARLGDTIVASVKEAHPNGKVKKGKVVYGVVVRAAMQRGRCDGSEVKFDDNAVVLVDKQGQPIGTRVFGPVPHELRKKKHVKILTLAKHIA